MLTMIVENDSKNSLKMLLDSLYYMFDMKAILHLVSAIRDLNYSSEMQAEAPKLLQIVLESFAFQSLYFQKVRNIGYNQHKYSFGCLWEKLSRILERNRILHKMLEDCMKKGPFSVGFGLYLYQQFSSLITLS